MNYRVCLVQAMHTIFQARHILFQVRLSLIVIPDLIRRHPELDSGQSYSATLPYEGAFILVLNRVQDDGSSLGRLARASLERGCIKM